MKNIYFKTAIAMASGVVLMFGVNATFATEQYSTGIAAFYNSSDPTTAQINKNKITELGCELRIDGFIAFAQGKVELATPNKYLILACETELLGNEEGRNAIGNLIANAENLAIMEGDITDFPEGVRDSEVGNRQYILKISHYNNKDANGRDAELTALTKEASKIENTYITQSFIDVNHAIGLPTPDEVVVLYYDNDEIANKFRDANGAFLEKIAMFNNAHLVDFVYYGGNVK